MSLNCKLSSPSSCFSKPCKLEKKSGSLYGLTFGWKWMRWIIFFWILIVLTGFIWFFVALNDGREAGVSHFTEEKALLFLEHFNVSKEQIRSFASLIQRDQASSLVCSKLSGYEMLPLSSNMKCALKLLSLGNDVVEKYDWALENIGSAGQCPIHDQKISQNSDASLQNDITALMLGFTSSPITFDDQYCYENLIPTKPLNKSTIDGCGSFLFVFLQKCCLMLFGLAFSWLICKFLGNIWTNQKQKLVQPQPLAQLPHILQQNQSSSRNTGKWRKKLLLTFVLGGVLGSVWLFWYLNQDITLRRKETLASMCDERARMLQDQFNVSMNHVHALAILVSTFYNEKEPPALDQKTFESYTEKTAFERPLTSGVSYALRVPYSMREEIEKQHGWPIRKMDDEDQTLGQELITEDLEPAPIREEYAPVIFSQKTVKHILSIDMMSGKHDRENILRARASGKGVLTSPFKLLKSNHLGVVLTFAVYNVDLPMDATPEQRVNATVGYVGASYDVPSLVERLLHQLASKQTIALNVYDTTNKLAPIKMYGDDVNDTGLLYVSYLDFGDPARKHEMHCRFKQKPPLPWTAIIASVGVLVITLLLGHIFHAAINRIAKVEKDYREMMKLKHRAEAADIAKSQFLATVSHEIRTPMNGVLGMLQMLMDTNLDVNQLDYAQTAHASGKDLISLINEVLDQAKIESGRLELEAVPFDLRADLDKVVSLLSSKSHEKEIELAVYVSDLVPEVVIGDPGRFRQIITNLVGNSIKFTKDKGHIFVSVHVADEVKCSLDLKDEVLRLSFNMAQDLPNATFNTLSGLPVVDRWKSWENFRTTRSTLEETNKIKLLVTVEDTGEGIPNDAQSRIFTPFVQADSSTSRKYGGTGIGLSISKRLVGLMGGEIGFVSEPETGSTFSFTAVFTKAENTSLITKWQLHDLTVSEFQGLRALVVDERGIRAEVTRYYLKRLHISVDIASTMNSAFSYLSSCISSSACERVDMVLIDKECWDDEAFVTVHCFLKELRSNGATSARGPTPKIFLLATPKSSSECIELNLAGTVDSVLTRPLRFSVLISCLQQVTGFGRNEQLTRVEASIGNLLKDRKILVVDDHPVIRKVARVSLQKYGAIVVCEASAIAALSQLKPPHDFDACFMDLQMPEMDGFQATRQIRNLEREYNEKIESGEISAEMSGNVGHWHTPILAMTADVIRGTNEACRECGMDGYVSKPFDDKKLYSEVAPFFQCV